MTMFRRVRRLRALLTLPETRQLIVTTVRTAPWRQLARRAATDRRGLIRDVTDPANARRLARDAISHPATAELANAGVLLLPLRYTPVAWVATWVARRVLRRSTLNAKATGRR